MSARPRFEPGDKVIVPVPFDTIGTVLDVHGTSKYRFARVLVPVYGPDGETLDEYDTSYPLTSLRLAGPDAA
jgi:hypothetical protein